MTPKIPCIVDKNHNFVVVSEVASLHRHENSFSFVLKCGEVRTLEDDPVTTCLINQCELYFDI
jgi:hypothetical protein